MRVLIDADDTIWNLVDHWIEEANRKYNLNVSSDDCVTWDITKLFPTLTEEQIFSIIDAPDFWSGVKPIEGAQHYIKKLMDENYDIMIVTSSYYLSIKDKFEKAFCKHFNFIPWNNIIICSRKQLIKGDFLVDDYINNLIDGEYTGILFSAYHNRYVDESQFGLCRCTTWEEVYNFIKESSRN